MFSNQDLLALLAVADFGSVRRAASELRRTQPAITQAVRRLEDLTGLTLLDRSAYRARLTESGERFVEHARQAVAQTVRLRDVAALMARGVEPRLRIGIDGAVADDVWMKPLQMLAQRFPQTEIEVETGESHSLRPRLMQGTIHVAILFNSTVNRDVREVESQTCGAAEFCTVIRADRVDALTVPKAVLPQIVVLDFNQPTLVAGLVPRQHRWRVSDHRMQVALIRDGLGWGTAPRALLETDLRQGTLQAVAYGGLRPYGMHDYSICRRPDTVQGPCATAVWDICRQPSETSDVISA